MESDQFHVGAKNALCTIRNSNNMKGTAEMLQKKTKGLVDDYSKGVHQASCVYLNHLWDKKQKELQHGNSKL